MQYHPAHVPIPSWSLHPPVKLTFRANGRGGPAWANQQVIRPGAGGVRGHRDGAIASLIGFNQQPGREDSWELSRGER